MDAADALFSLVAALVNAVIFAVLVRRIAGAPISLVRATIASLLATSIAQPVLRALVGEPVPNGQEPTVALGLYVCLLAAFAVVLALLLLVLAEMIIPDGSLPGPVELWRGWRSRLSRGRRYAEIVGIVTKHGLSRFLRGRRPAGASSSAERRELARALRRTLEEGGVTFVKLGQLLSTRRDLLPAEFVDELGQLRDQAAPASWDAVRAVLAAELPAPIEELFADLDAEPLAAASVAEVHAATLASGEAVVVKVQRPGVRPVVERDLEIVHRLARTLETTTGWGRSLGVRHLADGFAVALREELDFRVEAANMAAVADAARGRTDLVLPVLYPALCGERVLVMQRLVGTPLTTAGPLVAELRLDPAELARTLLGAVLRQVMLDGVFHADPHPGNVLLLADGRLGLLDFGSVGRLDTTVRGALQRLLLAVDRGDPLGVTDALLEVVPRPDEIDEQRLERAVGVLLARHLGPGGTAGVRMFTDLFRIVAAFGLSVPAEVAAVFRALATLEGTLSQLAPGFDLVAEARAFAAGQLAEQWRTGSPRQLVTDELTQLLPMLRRLPRRMERIAGALEHGRLTVNVRLFADERDRRFATGLLEQLLLTVLGATAGLMAVLLLGTSGGPVLSGQTPLFQLIGYFMLVVSSVLVLRVLVLIFRRDP